MSAPFRRGLVHAESVKVYAAETDLRMRSGGLAVEPQIGDSGDLRAGQVESRLRHLWARLDPIEAPISARCACASLSEFPGTRLSRGWPCDRNLCLAVELWWPPCARCGDDHISGRPSSIEDRSGEPVGPIQLRNGVRARRLDQVRSPRIERLGVCGLIIAVQPVAAVVVDRHRRIRADSGK